MLARIDKEFDDNEGVIPCKGMVFDEKDVERGRKFEFLLSAAEEEEVDGVGGAGSDAELAGDEDPSIPPDADAPAALAISLIVCPDAAVPFIT